MTSIASFEVKYRQYLDPEGRLTSDQPPPLASDFDQLRSLYGLMVLTRTFDAKAIKLQRTGKLGTYASSLGHEAIHVGIGAAMRPEDSFAPMYREYGTMLHRGTKMAEILTYWGGDERGSDFSGPAHDFPICVPIATQCLHAAGAALAFKLRGEERVGVTLVGDGGSSKGDFLEALNAAGAFQLPAVFVIANNQYAISVPRSRQSGARTLAQKGIAAGLPCIQIDGNDLLAVHRAMESALHRARTGGGASVIEMMTYRLSDHTTADDARR
ncbi:MAG: thiamine pyrophosphate-dependent enzyme, partial [Pseudomonadota bacterium]